MKRLSTQSVETRCATIIHYLKLDTLEEEPLLLKVFPFTGGCLIGTAALWNLAMPQSATAPYLELLSSPFTSAMACIELLVKLQFSLQNKLKLT